MNEFTWIKFYMELADKLLEYKNNRTTLIEKIKEVHNIIGMKLPTLEKDNNIVDVDPFTIFALFNKGIKNSNRIQLLEGFKTIFNIAAEVPEEFDGIPVVNNMKATFYYFEGDREQHDIDNLWELFEYAMNLSAKANDETKDKFASTFDIVIKQKGVSWNITMGLYWVRPYTFINLDARNRKLLENNYEKFADKFDVIKLLKSVPTGVKYLDIISSTKEIMTEYETFPELSYDAWKQSTEDKAKFYGEEEITYWPSLDEYNPNLSKDDWKKYITEVEKPNHPRPMQMLKSLMDIGGEATCKKLSEVYGGTVSGYVGCSYNLGRRVKKYFNLDPCMDGEQERFFPIPFLGRNVKNDNNEENYSYRIRPELMEALKEIDLSDVSLYYDEKDEIDMKSDIGKNLILYGPPGTGKTYNTVVYAVAIIEKQPLDVISAEAKENYSEVLSRYNEYKKQGRIEFTTFHQSFGYEEFIEGIKPVMNNDSEDGNADITYDVISGIFKEFCEKAASPVAEKKQDLGINNSPSVWKVSLWSTGDNPTRTECLENDHIRIGYDSYGPEVTQDTDFSEEGGRNVLNSFIYKMKIGDIVLSCYTNTTIDAIGVITGDYEWSGKYDDLNRVREVKWLVKGIEENILDINGGKTFSMPCVYETRININDVMDIVNKYSKNINEIKSSEENYVFIIDEINRGNISKIFGELITLIESSKRIGMAEGMTAKLPYSKKMFGVPSNVYIIGTMNTADRSIAAIDTALRRRFDFEEMLPQSEVLDGVEVEGISIPDMLSVINKRIEVLYDREHTIGHAYFIPLRTDNSIDNLANIFKNRIIPLLQEYFYENYERIRLVLGDNQKPEELQFIQKTSVIENDLFGEDTDEIEDAYKYTINEEIFKNIDAYKKMI